MRYQGASVSEYGHEQTRTHATYGTGSQRHLSMRISPFRINDAIPSISRMLRAEGVLKVRINVGIVYRMMPLFAAH
ncbi:hypothetical protein D9757_010880 [Collybiopsis confluens]|uniref:Uncharacterized protein n=1 Tax=Collybiopsis confluens TaxID=2823264 RepID=A0A8H5M214_9AGAR|nr:hypothetical protein D9757_010880 [Collybiopsis confluens]